MAYGFAVRSAPGDRGPRRLPTRYRPGNAAGDRVTMLYHPSASRPRCLRELSLALETREGMVVVAGCSHPGIDRIVQAATKIDP